jgi:DNA-binding response OmpR family regulator
MNIACLIRNPSVLNLVCATLKQSGFVCTTHPSETVLFRALRQQSPDLILVDFAAEPDVNDGILSWLNCRSEDQTPVLCLSAVPSAHFTALVLNYGADDVLISPFEPVELTARVHALVRRNNRGNTRRTIELAGFSLDRETSRLAYCDKAIEVTPREFSMAWLFFSSPGVFISRETIGASIWSTSSTVAGRTIEQHVYKLRKKLQLNAERGIVIRTAYNQGYRLELLEQKRPANAGDA